MVTLDKHDSSFENENTDRAIGGNRQSPVPLPSLKRVHRSRKATGLGTEDLAAVVLTGYSCPESLIQALESIFLQTHSSIEVVIVAKPEMLVFARGLNLPGPLRLIDIERNETDFSPREVGLEACSAPYVAYLEGGDFWPCHHLGDALAALSEDSQLGLVLGLLWDVRSLESLYTDRPKGLPWPRARPIRQRLPGPDPRWTISCVVARKKALESEPGLGRFLLDDRPIPRAAPSLWPEFLAEWRVGEFFYSRPVPTFAPSVEVIYDELIESLSRLSMDNRDALFHAVFLVRKAYRKLARAKYVPWSARRKFFDYASAIIRCIRPPADEGEAGSGSQGDGDNLTRWPDEEALCLEGLSILCESFEALGELGLGLQRIAELHFKEKCSPKEIARYLGRSEQGVDQDLRMAIDWLLERIRTQNPRAALWLGAVSESSTHQF